EKPRAGGVIEGSVSFPRGIATGTAFRVRLVCNRATVDSDGDRSWSKFWDRDQEVRAVAVAGDARLPFRFEIPDNLPGTADAEGSNKQYAWRVEARPSGAGATAMPYGFDVKVQPAPSMENPAHAFVDDLQPVALGPNVESMLSGAGVHLTAEQRRAVAKIPQAQQDKIVQLINLGPAIRKWLIIAVVAAFVIGNASDLVKAIEEILK